MIHSASSSTPTSLRYVLYARKSSEDEGSQIRSINDQISDCEQYAVRNNLIIKQIVKEQQSAKRPNNRPLFRRMLEDIKAGKYDGILFWHPDRLARNMLEAGEIIDMIDNGEIKDLQSPNFHFDNDSSGKMMLGMLFVFAKQYSEHLSESVLRGNAHNLDEGKSAGTPKWGYTRDKDGYYRPDSNFDIIKEGWEMRSDGASLNDVLDFWKKGEVFRTTKENPRKHTAARKIFLKDKATVSKIFRDPFYYGVLCQSGQDVDLCKIYNFQPMISRELYANVQTLSRNRSCSVRANQGKTFFPFRQMVICAECGQRMSVGASRNPKGVKYLYYRCDNKNCSRRPKSVRAHVILDALYKEVEKLEFTEKDYNAFSERLANYSSNAIDELNKDKHSLIATRSKRQAEFNELSTGLAKMHASSTGVRSASQRAIEDKLNMLENDIIELDNELREINEKLESPLKLTETKEEFLNIMKTLGFKMRNGTPAEKDNLARIMLLNIQISNKKEPHFLWKEPFDTLIKTKNVNSGAPDWT